MMLSKLRKNTFVIIFLAAFASSGCSVNLPKKEQVSIYTLDSSLVASPLIAERYQNLYPQAKHLYIARPTSYHQINSEKIFVEKRNYQVHTLKGCQWVDNLPVLFQARLNDRFIETNKLKGVYRGTHKKWSDIHLHTEITDFSYGWMQDQSNGRIYIRVVATLTDGKTLRPLHQKVFKQEVQIQQFNKQTIIETFNLAHQNIIDDIVVWTLTHI